MRADVVIGVSNLLKPLHQLAAGDKAPIRLEIPKRRDHEVQPVFVHRFLSITKRRTNVGRLF
jgi:hypothetical protein